MDVTTSLCMVHARRFSLLKKSMYRFLVVACLMTALVSCSSKKDYVLVFKDPNLFCATVYQLNTVVMGNNFPPIIASRNYLYANVAAYEVVAGGYPNQYN